MNEIATRSSSPVDHVSEAPHSEAAAIIQVLERAATNPDVDVDKLEKLLQMQERIMERNARAAYFDALSRAQTELPIISERGKIDIGRGKAQTYALWEDINEQVKPILAQHGFALSFRTGQSDGHTIVTGVLSHREGHSEDTTIYLPADTSGSKNAVQAVGSSTSYGKRYTAMALLNITSRGEDDDGAKAVIGAAVTEEQIQRLRAAADEVGADIPRFCRYLKIGALAELPARRFDEAMQALDAKREKTNA